MPSQQSLRRARAGRVAGPGVDFDGLGLKVWGFSIGGVQG